MGLVPEGRSLQVGTFQTNVPQNEARVDFFREQIEIGVRTCRKSHYSRSGGI